MKDVDMKIIMQLIMHGGNAKGEALKAIRYARKKDFTEADKSLENCDKELNVAHKAQTDLLTKEAREETIDFSLLMVHGQDHLMNAITTRDLAYEMVGILKDFRGGMDES